MCTVCRESVWELTGQGIFVEAKVVKLVLQTPLWKITEWTTRYGLCNAGTNGIFMIQVSLCMLTCTVIGDKGFWLLESVASIAKGSFFMVIHGKTLLNVTPLLPWLALLQSGRSCSVGISWEIPFWEEFHHLDTKNISLCWPEQYKLSRQ